MCLWIFLGSILFGSPSITKLGGGANPKRAAIAEFGTDWRAILPDDGASCGTPFTQLISASWIEIRLADFLSCLSKALAKDWDIYLTRPHIILFISAVKYEEAVIKREENVNALGRLKISTNQSKGEKGDNDEDKKEIIKEEKVKSCPLTKKGRDVKGRIFTKFNG